MSDAGGAGGAGGAGEAAGAGDVAKGAARASAGDMLADIFERQARLSAFYVRTRPDGYYSWPPIERATTMTRAIIHECCELDDELNWKPWKNPRALDENRAARLMETADILHFLVQLAQDQGFSATELYQAYVQKNEENWERQRSDPRYRPASS